MLDSMGRGTRASERTPAPNHLKPSQPREIRADPALREPAPTFRPSSSPRCTTPRRYLGIAASDMEAVVARGLSEARAIEHGVSSEAW